MSIRRWMALVICPGLGRELDNAEAARGLLKQGRDADLQRIRDLELELELAGRMGADFGRRKEILLLLIGMYANHKELAVTTVSAQAANDGKFYGRLMGDGTIRAQTYADVMHWFSDNWPDDLPWPQNIARPDVAPAKKDAA